MDTEDANMQKPLCADTKEEEEEQPNIYKKY